MVEHHTNDVIQIALSCWHSHLSLVGSKALAEGIIDAIVAAIRSLLTIISELKNTVAVAIPTPWSESESGLNRGDPACCQRPNRGYNG
jgi:hypothetical protein